MFRRLIRCFVQGSSTDGFQESFKKPRRSERLSSQKVDDAHKTPISTKQQLPSPVTRSAGDTDESSYFKEATSTPPDGKPIVPFNSEHFTQSSPPQETQAFPSQTVDPDQPLSDEVEDEVKEGVWGYLTPLDPRYGDRVIVLRKRAACHESDTVAEEIASKQNHRNGRRGGPLGQETALEQSKKKGIPAGGFLIGRHAECGKWKRDPSSLSSSSD
jgi:serine/threonine-protein kinase Chk2